MTSKIYAVIPAYNEAEHIADVIGKIPEEINRIIVVDDCSEDNTSEVVKQIEDTRIKLIRLKKNEGVGGSMIAGYRYCLEKGADVVVKIDGDGQMNPEEIPKIISPILRGQADYSKGFRFTNAKNVKQMPKIRLLGNIFLSFCTKFASGYWNIFDPSSGFTAIHREALSRLDLDNINNRYFFETDMLINLYRLRAVVCDVEITNNYGTEESQLNPIGVILPFLYLLIKSFFKRIIFRYFVVDFTPVSLFIVLGIPLWLFGFFFGLYHWISNYIAQISTPTGTIMIAVLSLFFGFQFMLQGFILDINNVPKIPLQITDKNIPILIRE